MKRNRVWLFGCIVAVACSAVYAESSHKVVMTTATQLSVDEMAFAAQLDDKNRKSFNDKFSAPQRKAVMIAVKNGANADLAVQNMLAAQEVKRVDLSGGKSGIGEEEEVGCVQSEVAEDARLNGMGNLVDGSVDNAGSED
jgi:hypothetical protein